MIKRSTLRFSLVSLLSLLWATMGFGLTETRAGDLRLKTQLIWATDEEKPKEKKLKEVESKLADKLRRFYKWKNYFEVSSTNVVLVANVPQKLTMSRKCEMELKRVDEGERVGLSADAAGEQSRRSARSRRRAGGSGGQASGQEPHGMLRDPVTRLDVKPDQIRVQFLLLGDEAGHHRYPDLAGEEAHRMKERGEGQDTGWSGEGAGGEGLQDDRGDEPDERERLADCHQQLGPEVVLGGPCAGELCVDQAHRANRRKPQRHQQARIESLVQQVRSEHRQEHLRHRRPEHGGPDGDI